VSELENTGVTSPAWDDLARAAGSGGQVHVELDELRQLIAFTIDDTPYAVPVEFVREIVRIRPITPVPRVSSHVRGVISLRGEIVQVVDLRLRLGLDRAEITRSSRIIVIHTEDGRVAGILVDSVQEVLRVKEDAILPPTGGESGSVESLCVRDEEFVSIIDLERVLDVDVER